MDLQFRISVILCYALCGSPPHPNRETFRCRPMGFSLSKGRGMEIGQEKPDGAIVLLQQTGWASEK